LNVQEDSCVIEVDHGIGGHVKDIIRKANTVQYIGLEISKTMNSEVIRINKSNQKQAYFILYDEVNIPLGINIFDKILTINAIYFWNNSRLFLKEIYRALKLVSKLVIGSADKKFMLSLPFVNHRLKLYSKEILTDLFVNSPFVSNDFTEKRNSGLSKSGELVNRICLVAELFK
jgi:SAM-dependent methyltransferase